jgi:chorismate-pyruvate lyase
MCIAVAAEMQKQWLSTEGSRTAILHRRRQGQHISICKNRSVLAKAVADRDAFF